jgi:hypothetical protein
MAWLLLVCISTVRRYVLLFVDHGTSSSMVIAAWL